MKFLRSFVAGLLDFLFPKNKEVLVLESLSPEDLYKILPQATGPDDENIIALFDYTHPVTKEIIWEIKYGGNRILASHLGELLYDVIVAELEERMVFSKWPTPILIPMPVSGKRRFERGWNQAELLAEAIKKCDQARHLKYLPGQLVKTIHTESQTKTASKRERKHNLENSMKVMNPLSVKGRFVILVDDVVTTGSTFAEARRALRAAGAKKILCVAVSH